MERGTSMRMHEGNTTGYAGGWRVWSTLAGWQWSAYGPGGGTMGSAATEELAGASARMACANLARGPRQIAFEHPTRP